MSGKDAAPSLARQRFASRTHDALLGGGALAAVAWGLARGAHPLLAAAWLAAGVALLSLVEYLVHRHLFHGQGRLAAAHAQHHEHPEREQIDAASYWLPLLPPFPVAWALSLATGDAAAGACFAAGMCVGYVRFRYVHRRLHEHQERSPALAAFHQGHHDDEACHFGVTTRLWDRLFGTEAARVAAGAGRP